jgi:hypothetical protein
MATITTNVLKEYRTMIANTISDLEQHLQNINNRLQTISAQESKISEQNIAERTQLYEEIESTQQCLSICSQASEHIDKVQPSVLGNIPANQGDRQMTVTTFQGFLPAKQITNNALEDCRGMIANTTSELKIRL